MAVKIRLKRLGKKKRPVYRVVVADSRKARNGSYIESLGRYDPHQEPSLVEIDNEKAVGWLQNGAQPTETARKLLEISGAWSQFKVAKGEIHTVGAKPAPKAVEAEEAVEAAEEAVTDTTEEVTVEADRVVEEAAEAVQDAPEEVVEAAEEVVEEAAEEATEVVEEVVDAEDA
jgi:small subunit ribosomal protein S16